MKPYISYKSDELKLLKLCHKNRQKPNIFAKRKQKVFNEQTNQKKLLQQTKKFSKEAFMANCLPFNDISTKKKHEIINYKNHHKEIIQQVNQFIVEDQDEQEIKIQEKSQIFQQKHPRSTLSLQIKRKIQYFKQSLQYRILKQKTPKKNKTNRKIFNKA